MISIFIIYAIHVFWNYLKDTLTVKKTKDLVSIQAEKYKKIVEEIQQTNRKPFETDMERKEMEADLSQYLAEITKLETI